MTPKALSREMRSREEIIGDVTDWIYENGNKYREQPNKEKIIVEVLLDIRDLLTKENE